MDKRVLILGGMAILLFFYASRNVIKDLIGKFEGVSLTPYKDAAGIWTIGYGHKIVPGDPYYPYGDIQEITQKEADALLQQDLIPAKAAVQGLVTVPLTQNQKDALTSFVFNVGQTAFADSTLLKKLNAGDYQGAADEFANWIHAGGQILPGLVARREAEAQLFMS